MCVLEASAVDDDIWSASFLTVPSRKRYFITLISHSQWPHTHSDPDACLMVCVCVRVCVWLIWQWSYRSHAIGSWNLTLCTHTLHSAPDF